MGQQLILPIFPSGCTEINNAISFKNEDDCVYYFHGCLPIFFHSVDDLESFRFITAQFYLNGHVTQQEIVKIFGVSAISVKRSVKTLKESGISGFKKKLRKVKKRKMSTEVLEKVQELLNQGESCSYIATKLNLKSNTIQKLIRGGTLKKKYRNHVLKQKVKEATLIKSPI